MSEPYNTENVTIKREGRGAGKNTPNQPQISGLKPRAEKPSDKLPPVSRPQLSKFEIHRMKIVAVLIALFAVLLFLALVSYTPYDEANTAVSGNDLVGLFHGNEQVRAKADTTQNWLGLLGAIMANFCYNYSIGYAALIFPALLILWSKHIYKKSIDQKLIFRTTLVITFGVIFSAFTGTCHYVSWLPHLRPEWSGAVGQFISDIFSKLIGATGSFLILIAATIIALIVGIDFDIEKTLLRLKLRWDKFLDKYEAWKKAQAVKKEALHQEQQAMTEEYEQEIEDKTKYSTPDSEEPARVLRRSSDNQGVGVAENLGEIRLRYNASSNFVDDDDEIEPEIPKKQEEPPQKPIEKSSGLKIQRYQRDEEPIAPPKPIEKPEATDELSTKSKNSELTDEEIALEALQNPKLILTVTEIEKEKMVSDKEFLDHNPLDEELQYSPPSIDLLVLEDEHADVDDEELKEKGEKLQEKLKTFKIEIEDLTVTPGPVVTQYEFVPAAGVKVSQIENLADDIALALKARGIRIIAPVPGRGTVAVEIPNNNPSMVRFSSIIRSPRFKDSKHRLPMALGKTINGEVYCDDLVKMPHLLIAGSTGSGKSVGINTIICSLLYKMHPRYLKLLIIDPKKVEMTHYQKLVNHFLAISPDIDEEIVTTPANAVIALKAVVVEMENRYDILAKVAQRNIADYNKKVEEGKYIGNKSGDTHRELPYIVVIIDELADLMITAGRDIEEPITRLAQLARAVGIHLVVATQRPSVDVITGIIKANFPARIAYQVASKIDSRTIIDGSGAEQLLGNGDMLYLPGGMAKPLRVQNSFLSTEEVEAICDHIGQQIGYSQPYMLPSLTTSKSGGRGGDRSESVANANGYDELFEDAARIIVRHQQGSVSLLQRRLKIGYSRAARIVDQLEESGIVGSFDGSKAREVLVESEAELEAYL